MNSCRATSSEWNFSRRLLRGKRLHRVKEKDGALYLTTMLFEHSQKAHRKPYFCHICRCTNNIAYARFELYFLKTFMRLLRSRMLQTMEKRTSRHSFPGRGTSAS